MQLKYNANTSFRYNYHNQLFVLSVSEKLILYESVLIWSEKRDGYPIWNDVQVDY